MAGNDDARRAREQRLDEIAHRYDPSNAAESFDWRLKRSQVAALLHWLDGERVLELGCATGELTSLVAPFATAYDVVEGSAENIAVAARRNPSVRFVHSLWEEFEPTDEYSDVLLVNALEHAADARAVLDVVRRCLATDGRVHVFVPNGLSLHRLVGVEMGFLPDPVALSEADAAIGHFRNYTVDTLLAELRGGAWSVVHWEGVFLKPLSNAQMLTLDPAVVDALDAVGRRFPEHCALLYAVATPR